MLNTSRSIQEYWGPASAARRIPCITKPIDVFSTLSATTITWRAEAREQNPFLKRRLPAWIPQHAQVQVQHEPGAQHRFNLSNLGSCLFRPLKRHNDRELGRIRHQLSLESRCQWQRWKFSWTNSPISISAIPVRRRSAAEQYWRRTTDPPLWQQPISVSTKRPDKPMWHSIEKRKKRYWPCQLSAKHARSAAVIAWLAKRDVTFGPIEVFILPRWEPAEHQLSKHAWLKFLKSGRSWRRSGTVN